MRREFSVSKPGAGPFLHIGTYLPMKRYRDIPAFVQLSERVNQQLRQTPGVVRVGVAARLLSRQFWTCSIWQASDEETIQDFVHSGPHAEAIRKAAKWSTGAEGFARWTTSSASAIHWDELFRRLPPK